MPESYRSKILARSRTDFPQQISASEEVPKNKGDTWRRFRRNPTAMIGLILLILLIAAAVLASVIYPEGYDVQDYSSVLQAPSAEHPFGTDKLGRDILCRCVWGARYSLSVGLISVIIAAFFGTILGLVSAFYGGKVDNLLMRFLDVFMSIPPFLLALTIVAALGTGMLNLMIAVGIGSIPQYARIMRSSVMTIKDEEFVEAAVSTGCSKRRIMFKYILPNCLSPLIVQITLGVASAILTCSGMSFLGLGIEPPIPEWGAMLSGGRSLIRQAWWVCTFPGLLIALTVFALNVIGDGMRDALDPKLKR